MSSLRTSFCRENCRESIVTDHLANGMRDGGLTVEALLALPYFDILASLGLYSLHPGGPRATARVVDAAGVRAPDAVLEVGCGTGVSTLALMHANFCVAVAEPNARMLDATLRNCRRILGQEPIAYATDAESLGGVPTGYFDLVLFEAVFGFMHDREAAIAQCRRVLRPEMGRVAIIDFHYTCSPPESVRRAVGEVVGHTIDVLDEGDWRDLFAGWTTTLWDSIPLPPLSAPTTPMLRESLRRSEAAAALASATDTDLDRLTSRLVEQNAIFRENQKYMRAHHVVAQVPGFTARDHH
jgi:SAM-dependent methyltransferase